MMRVCLQNTKVFAKGVINLTQALDVFTALLNVSPVLLQGVLSIQSKPRHTIIGKGIKLGITQFIFGLTRNGEKPFYVRTPNVSTPGKMRQGLGSKNQDVTNGH